MERHWDDRVDGHAARDIAGQARLAAVVEPTDRATERARMPARRAERDAAVVGDRLASHSAGNTEPAPELIAACAARRQQDVADPERELHHLAAISDEMSSSPACVAGRGAVSAGVS